ncbi:MAG TPA: phage major capsid protein [Pseudobdellovibrionaceae bacterium]|jgi:hypothetical protein
MAQMSLTASSALFKTKFGKMSENAYNSYNPMLGTIKKQYDFTGDEMKVAVPTFFSGGVGSGSLPTANPASAVKATLTAKKVYATTEIDRESLKASSNDEGSFVNGMKWVSEKTVEAYNRNASRILFSDGTGALGTTTAADFVDVTGTTFGVGDTAYALFTAASWVEGYWEENDYVNVGTAADVLEVIAVDNTLRKVTFEKISGTTDFGTGGAGTSKIIYMQNSKDNDPMGLKGVCDATTSTLYGVDVARRWMATQIAAASAGISEDIMNELVITIQKKCGKAPKKLVTSYTQYRKISNFLEDKKVYQIEARAPELKGIVGWKALSYMSDAGEIAIIPDRMCAEDRVYGVNDDYITSYHRPDFGWFDDDGTVFLRTSGDAYAARYGGYYQNYIIPSFQGVVTGLAT